MTRYFTEEHEWIEVEGDTATVGVTDYAQSELGDIVFVELPSPGRSLRADESFGSVESVKTVSDIYSPLAGEVVEVNDALGAQSELLNSDPYGKGWLVKMRLNDPEAAGSLLDPDTYRASLDH